MKVEFLGYNISYHDGMARMRQCIAAMQDSHNHEQTLLLLEHKPTITVTRLHGRKNLLVDDDYLIAHSIDVVETDRGGDITFHGPGQLVGYPILYIGQTRDENGMLKADLLGYVRKLETALMVALDLLGIDDCFRIDGMTGVWVNSNGQDKKLVAIGVGVSNGVTRHGFALNIFTDLLQFVRCIIPCGLLNKGVTNLSDELTKREKPLPSEHEICLTIAFAIGRVFGFDAHLDQSLMLLGEHDGRKDYHAPTG